MLQLQQIWLYSERMLEEEREGNLEIFQMQQRETHHKGL